jgi:2-polyprenyl-3-methyl-5-hydroxy-6-metoxy-1,4-benzoquinol methylase
LDLRARSYQQELLDKDDIPFSDIRTTMRELNVINTLLGGHAITQRGIRYFINNNGPYGPLTIAEIGCGGGDNLIAIHKYCERMGLPVSLVGVDIKQECIGYAQTQVPADTMLICSDYRTTRWPDGKPDIIFSSLFCHHFTDEQMAEQLNWLRDNSRLGFFINDLHRHPLAYHSISILTRLFSRSYLVKNDAPLSVARSFRRHDWQRLLAGVGISNYDISWHWAFRFLVCVAHGRQ